MFYFYFAFPFFVPVKGDSGIPRRQSGVSVTYITAQYFKSAEKCAATMEGG